MAVEGKNILAVRLMVAAGMDSQVVYPMVVVVVVI